MGQKREPSAEWIWTGQSSIPGQAGLHTHTHHTHTRIQEPITIIAARPITQSERTTQYPQKAMTQEDQEELPLSSLSGGHEVYSIAFLNT